MSTALTPSALANADLIRTLADPGRPDDLFEASGAATRSSFKRTLDRMAEDGLVRFGGAAGKPFLTEAGQRARKALDVAEGLASSQGVAPHAAFTPHPDNPREHCAPAELESLADTIEAERGLLQPLHAGRPDANGVRLIYIGERRWRAIGLLIARGSEVGARPIPFVERDDAEPGLIHELSLVENEQRVPLTPLERAYALAALGKARNLTAPKLAKRTGIDLKLVQEALKVVAEASPEDIAAHKADPVKHTWTQLRDSVKVAKPTSLLPDLSDAERCALIELAFAILHRMGPQPSCTRVHGHQGDPTWLALRDRNLIKPVVVGDGRMYAELGSQADRWVREEVHFYLQPDAVTAEARGRVVGALQAASLGTADYVTSWLNVPADPPSAADAPLGQDERARIMAEHPMSSELMDGMDDGDDDEAMDGGLPAPAPDPAVALYADMAGKTLEGEAAKPKLAPAPPMPTTTDLPTLTPDLAVILVELAWAIQDRGLPPGDGRPARVVAGRYFEDVKASALTVQHRMLAFGPGPKNNFVAYPTPRGWAWLEAHGYARDGAPKVSPGTLQAAIRNAASSERTEALINEGRLLTDWLNPEAAPAVAPEPLAVSEGKATASHSDGQLVLDEVRAACADTAEALATLFEMAGLEGPFDFDGDPQTATLVDANGNGVCTVDVNGDMDEPLVVARAELIVRALNAALGLEGGE